MTTILRLLTSLAPLIGRTGVCANVGLIAGAVTGLLLTLADLMHGALVVDNGEAAQVALLLAALAWLVVLFILCALVRFTIRSVALPALVTCLLTSFVLVFVCKWLGVFSLAWLVGILAGLLVGRLLCWMSAYLFASGRSD